MPNNRIPRAIMWGDVVFTAMGAALCLAAPRAFAAGYFVEPPTPALLEAIRWLGLMFLFTAGVVGRGLVVGQRAFWQVVLPVLVLGDTMHFIGSVRRSLLPECHLTATSWFDLALVCVYLPYRVWAWRHPERLDRARKPEPR